MDVAFGEPEENYQKAIELMTKAMKEKPDILVLPETMNVGFFPKENLKNLSDTNGTKTKAVFGGFAKKYNVNVVAGSVANRKNDFLYNSVYVFDRNGSVVGEYDKIHCFTPSNEHCYFKGGDKTIIFELDGIRCSCVVCYDIRFPELVRTITVQGIDLLFVPAEWPLQRNMHWTILNTARAIENQIYVCAVNACGYAGKTKYGGNSLLIDPLGKEICHLGTDEAVVSGEIDTAIIDGIRKSINVYHDRKPECYK